jgi:hypothetical protein
MTIPLDAPTEGKAHAHSPAPAPEPQLGSTSIHTFPPPSSASASGPSSALPSRRASSVEFGFTSNGKAGNGADEARVDADEEDELEMEMKEADRLIRDVEAKEAAAATSSSLSSDPRGGRGEGYRIPAYLIIREYSSRICMIALEMCGTAGAASPALWAGTGYASWRYSPSLDGSAC